MRQLISLAAFFISIVLPATCLAGYEHTVYFDTRDKGEDKAMTTWGMGTIGGPGVMQSGLDNMGADQIDLVLIPFPVKDRLNGDGKLMSRAKAQLKGDLATAKMAGDKPLVLSPDTEAGINPWYRVQPGQMNTDNWSDLLIQIGEYINRPIAWVQPFNEPDWAQWGQGSPEDLDDIMRKLKRSSVFKNSKMAGPAVLNIDTAKSWFEKIRYRVDIATMHTLIGSVDNYVDFIEYVKKKGKTPFNPEIHNLSEAIIGAEYGMDGGIWWMPCSVERGSFVKACQGKRLGYEEDREKWSAAAVYRAPDGKVQAFLGCNERQGQDTTYRFVCRNRDVYFNGEGPQKDFVVTIKQNEEKMINITWK